MDNKRMFRLCHVCGNLNESEEEILKCQQCAKSFLPVNYFDKIRARAQKAEKVEEPMPSNLLANPINGLIVFW